MKKIIAFVLSAVMLSALAGCVETTEVTSRSSAGNSETPPVSAVEKKYRIGETWTVEGQWSLTINSVVEMDDRNEFCEKNPAAVYLVSYTYTNQGYEDELGLMDGLFFWDPDAVVDSAGIMGYTYPNEITDHPMETPVYATCKAQVCIGVDNAGEFTMTYIRCDGKGNKQTATFIVEVK